jgi:hypothetical protein
MPLRYSNPWDRCVLVSCSAADRLNLSTFHSRHVPSNSFLFSKSKSHVPPFSSRVLANQGAHLTPFTFQEVQSDDGQDSIMWRRKRPHIRFGLCPIRLSFRISPLSVSTSASSKAPRFVRNSPLIVRICLCLSEIAQFDQSSCLDDLQAPEPYSAQVSRGNGRHRSGAIDAFGSRGRTSGRLPHFA